MQWQALATQKRSGFFPSARLSFGLFCEPCSGVAGPLRSSHLSGAAGASEGGNGREDTEMAVKS